MPLSQKDLWFEAYKVTVYLYLILPGIIDYSLFPLLFLDFDPALGMMTGIPPITPMMPGLGIVPPPIPPDMPVVKEIIHCKSCTLFPPNPSNTLLFLHTSQNVLVYQSFIIRFGIKSPDKAISAYKVVASGGEPSFGIEFKI